MIDDAAAWDRRVAAAPLGSYMQTSAWAEVKAANGWRAVRIAATRGGAGGAGGESDAPGGDPGAIAAQILLRRPRGAPWTYAYAPRGPIADRWDPATIRAFSGTVRRRLPALAARPSHLRIDPEVELDGPDDPAGSTRAALREAGWRPAPPVQANASRIVDLTLDEAELWSGLRKKWRQYVNRAKGAGVTVVAADGDRLPEFYAIYRETASRAQFVIRTEAAYRAVWQAFSARSAARLLFAVDPAGEALATLLLLRCGGRIVEPYGGMTERGADTRANYLLKWEAMRLAKAEGARQYDMWGGLAFPGIAHFKAGFGGREVQYIGAWDLVLDRLGWTIYVPGRAAIGRLRRGARRLRGGADASDAPAAADA